LLTVRTRLASISCAAAALSALLGGAACVTRTIAPSAPPAGPLRAASLEEALAAFDGYCRGIDTLSASGDLDVRDFRAGKARKVGVRLVAARGGKLYIKGSVAVVTALEVVADGQRFWFQIPSRKKVWTGRAQGHPRPEDEQAPYYALRPADVAAALLPEPIAPRADDAVLMEGDREAFTLTVADKVRGPVRRAVRLERASLRPVGERRYDEDGNVVAVFLYAAWDGRFPRRIVVGRPVQGYEAEFSLDKADVNTAVPDRAFVPRVPPDYEVIEVGS
jgi:outer membrane lipoprotein-sorting protein